MPHLLKPDHSSVLCYFRMFADVWYQMCLQPKPWMPHGRCLTVFCMQLHDFNTCLQLHPVIFISAYCICKKAFCDVLNENDHHKVTGLNSWSLVAEIVGGVGRVTLLEVCHVGTVEDFRSLLASYVCSLPLVCKMQGLSCCVGHLLPCLSLLSYTLAL